MSSGIAIIAGAFVALTGVIVYVVVMAKRASITRQETRQASADLPPLNPALAEGINFTLSFRARSKNTPASVTVKADYPFKAPISFKTESGMDRFGKLIGLASEVQSGDSGFDQAVYVDSPYPEYAGRMLGDSDNRRALRRCFAAFPKLSRISCGPKGSTLLFTPAERQQVPPEMVSEVLAALPGLRQSVERLEFRRSAWRERIGLLVIVATSVLGVLAMIPLIVGLGAFESLDGGIFIPGLLGGLAVGLAWAVVAWLVLRGRSNAVLPFILALTIGLADFSMIGIGAIHIANGVLDSSVPQSRQLTVTKRYISHGKNSTSYWVEYQPWNEKVSGSLSVGRQEYERLAPGAALTITSSAGGLGYERLISFE